MPNTDLWGLALNMLFTNNPRLRIKLFSLGPFDFVRPLGLGVSSRFSHESVPALFGFRAQGSGLRIGQVMTNLRV